MIGLRGESMNHMTFGNMIHPNGWPIVPNETCLNPIFTWITPTFLKRSLTQEQGQEMQQPSDDKRAAGDEPIHSRLTPPMPDDIEAIETTRI